MKTIYNGFYNKVFNYTVILKGHSFPYTMGCGHHYYLAYGNRKDDPKDIKLDDNTKVEIENDYPSSHRPKTKAVVVGMYARFPKDEDILESLESDVNAGNMTFHYFCEEFGYNTDSISALKMYLACQDTATKLADFKFPERKEN